MEIISIHIGKTAGTAFRRVLAQIYGEQNVIWDYPPYDYKLSTPLPTSVRAIHGHFASGKYINFFLEAKWIVWLRHPVLRLISEYFFAQIHQDSYNFLHAELVDKKLSLLEFAEQPLARNIQSNHIVGKQLTEFEFVGLQEFYSEDLAELQDRMQWATVKGRTENTNPHPHYCQALQAITSDSRMMNQLAALNQDDMELYQEAICLRAARRQESPSLQYLLAGLRQSQPLLHHVQTELKQLKVFLQQPHPDCVMLETTKVDPDEISEKLLGFSIDSPLSSIEIASDTLLISGWAIGQKSKAVALQVILNGQILTEAPINCYRPDVAEVHAIPGATESGFATTVTIVGMQLHSALQLQILLEDQEKAIVGSIRPVQARPDLG
jgi:Sulfotransferase family